jgi:lysophospholipase L1-like esterase
MLMRRAIRNTLTVLISGAVSVVLAELFVRAFVTVRDVGPVFTVHDPVLGKRIKPSFAGERTTPEFKMRLTTNSLGFRGPEPTGFPERPILFLGDSFTLGYGVSDGEEYPALVAAELRRRYGTAAAPVVNAGIGNSGNGFWLKLLRGEASNMQPRLVVMQFTDNDFTDNLADGLFVLDTDGTLRELPVPAPGMMRRIEALVQAVPGLSYSHLLGLLRSVRLPTMSPRPSQSAGIANQHAREAAERLTLRIIEQAISLAEQRGWTVVGLLAGLPAAQEAVVGELFLRRNLALVRIPSKAERPDLYYKIDGHWHAAGHTFVAQRLLEALEAPMLHTPGRLPSAAAMFLHATSITP